LTGNTFSPAPDFENGLKTGGFYEYETVKRGIDFRLLGFAPLFCPDTNG
jgi:hypothetical protein